MYYNNLKNTVSQVLRLATRSEEASNVSEALDILLQYFSAERIFIGSFGEGKDPVPFFSTHYNMDKPIPISESLIDSLKKGLLPWWISSIKEGQDVVVSDISQMPAEAKPEQDIFLSNQIKSILSVPTYYGGKINGFIGIDYVSKTHEWTQEEISDLQMFANIISVIIKHIELVKIKEADKMKSAFVANMSHEIRTPLNTIIGFSNLLAEENRTEENTELVDLINKNNDILLGLVDDILDFSKIESGTMTYLKALFDMKEVCQEVVASYKGKIPNQIQLTFDNSTSDSVVYTDRKRIKQIICNYINNSLKFTEKGSIRILCDTIPGNFLRISIADTGIGIPPEDIHFVFDRYYKGNAFKQGVGLGLPIVKTVAEDLGGSVGVESESGKGSLFWFTVPLPEPIEEID